VADGCCLVALGIRIFGAKAPPPPTPPARSRRLHSTATTAAIFTILEQKLFPTAEKNNRRVERRNGLEMSPRAGVELRPSGGEAASPILEEGYGLWSQTKSGITTASWAIRDERRAGRRVRRRRCAGSNDQRLRVDQGRTGSIVGALSQRRRRINLTQVGLGKQTLEVGQWSLALVGDRGLRQHRLRTRATTCDGRNQRARHHIGANIWGPPPFDGENSAISGRLGKWRVDRKLARSIGRKPRRDHSPKSAASIP